MGKYAVIVGINYHDDPKAALKGCVNDAHMMKDVIRKKGFPENNIKMINDEDKDVEKPSGANVKKALHWLCSNRTAEDVIFFHYSGHGVQIRDSTFSRDEADGKDEAIVLQHGFLLADDDLKQFFGMLPAGCQATVVMDCCHSGGILDGTSVAIGGDKSRDTKVSRGLDDEEHKNRSLPVTILASMLSDKLGGKNVSPDRKGINGSLAEIFGGDACKLAMQFAAAQLNGGSKPGGDPMAMIASLAVGALAGRSSGKRSKSSMGFGALASQFLGNRKSKRKPQKDFDLGALLASLGLGGKDPITSHGAPAFHQPSGQSHKNACILVTGCAADETSADVRPKHGKPHGALTAALQKKFEENKNSTNKELVMGVRSYLLKKGTAQNPQLECLPKNADLKFICPS